MSAGPAAAGPRYTYERVTFRPAGGARLRTIYLQSPASSGAFLTGVEVDGEGDEVSGKGFDERRHFIELSAVTKRVPMVMDKYLGRLVPPGLEAR